MPHTAGAELRHCSQGQGRDQSRYHNLKILLKWPSGLLTTASWLCPVERKIGPHGPIMGHTPFQQSQPPEGASLELSLICGHGMERRRENSKPSGAAGRQPSQSVQSPHSPEKLPGPSKFLHSQASHCGADQGTMSTGWVGTGLGAPLLKVTVAGTAQTGISRASSRLHWAGSLPPLRLHPLVPPLRG